MNRTNGTTSVTRRSEAAARLSLSAVGIFLGLVTLLHFIEPEFAPTWRFMSEYSNGDFGWVMKVGFFVLAFSCAMLIPAIRPHVKSTSGKVGFFLLGFIVIGMVMAGLFNQDPLTSRETTPHGNLHGVATMIGIPGFSVSSLLIGWSLARHTQAWAAVRRPLLWLSNLAWISLVAMFAYMGIAIPQAGGFGPTVWVGLLNRVWVLAMCAWLVFVAWQSLKLRRQAY